MLLQVGALLFAVLTAPRKFSVEIQKSARIQEIQDLF